MAKRKRRSKPRRSKGPAQRKASDFTRSKRRERLKPERRTYEDRFRKPLIRRRSPTEDFRDWHPDKEFRRPKDIFGAFAEIEEDYPSKNLRARPLFRFREPWKVVECRKRKARRSVLFSRRKVGKGKSGPRFRRMTIKSEVRCK